jgi:hypothetical protein
LSSSTLTLAVAAGIGSAAIAVSVAKPNTKVTNKTLIIRQVEFFMTYSPFFGLFNLYH